MVKVEFKMNGRSVRSDAIANQLEKALLNQFQDGIKEKLRSVHDPENGDSPTVTATGRSLDNLSFEVSSFAALIE